MAQEDIDKLPDRDALLKLVTTTQAAQRAQSAANELKAQAEKITDNDERKRLSKEAFDKEVEANGYTKTAKRLQSGTWQGLGFGGGIGAASGLGLGAGVGTLLGGLLFLPTTGLGMLIGSGVGALHGPWVRLGGKEQKYEDADPNELVDAALQQRSGGSQKNTEQAKSEQPAKATASAAPETTRRRPKKLEMRSKQSVPSGEEKPADVPNGPIGAGVEEKSTQRRKPKKLEIRSNKQVAAAKS